MNGCKESVLVDKFPRQNDHPTRMLIGCTSPTGETIYQTAIPTSVSENHEAGWFYQIHVFLHEFFHTVELPRRNPADQEKVILNSRFTLEDWWNEWVELFARNREPGFITPYAAAYAEDLTEEARVSRPKKHAEALAEQMCEVFVAYRLGVAPNDAGWTDFLSESFGNTHQKKKASGMPGHIPASEKGVLMRRLCDATLCVIDC